MTEPTRSRDAIHDATAWAHRYTRSKMTTGEADAWRAARDACAAKLRDAARRMRDAVNGEPGGEAHIARCIAAALELHADAIEAMQPGAEATGLCERGG